ncbi:hypothetical protein BGX30_013647 [Mortierella sp. GBA39]|nr:hypothetical protein BGX30_013647 [Mortierella sp. GBA39]
MSQDNSSTLPLTQKHWLDFSLSQLDHNTTNNNSGLHFSANSNSNRTFSRSGSGLTHASSDRTLSRNITSSSPHLILSSQTSRKQPNATNHDSLPYSQPVGKSYSSSYVIPTLELGSLPSFNNSPSTEREFSGANSVSPTTLMADSSPSALAAGSRSRPISIPNTLSSGLASSSQPRYSSPVRTLLPAYHPQSSPTWTPKNKAAHLQKNPPTPGVSSVTLRGSSLLQKGRDGDPPQRGGQRSTAGVGDGSGADGSVGRSQPHSSLSLSSLLAGSTPEQSRLIDKISTLTTVVSELQHTLDNHIQRTKQNEDRTSVAVEEASKKAVERIQLKTEELVEAMVTQTRKTILQRLDGSLQDWTKVLTEQLKVSTNDIRDLVSQGSMSQSKTTQDVAADIRQTFKDCIQRFGEQVDLRIVEEKGQGMVMSMVAQTEKVVQQCLGESLQKWTETLTGQLRTAVDAIQDQAQHGSSGQSPTPQQDMNDWRSQCGALISNEISDLKTTVAALNASTQLLQEQVRITRNLNQQGVNEGRGSSYKWLTPMSHRNSLSPTPAPREGQAHPSQVGVTRRNDEHGATTHAMQSPTLPSTLVPLFNSPSTVTTMLPNNPAPEQKAAVNSSTKGKRAQAQKRAPRSITGASGSGRQNPTSAGESAPRPLSAISKGKQVMRREAWLQLGTGAAGAERLTQTPALMSKAASLSRTSTLTTAPSLSDSDTDGDGYVIIQGLSGSAFTPTVAKRGRGRPSTNSNHASVKLPSNGPCTSSKRMKLGSADVTLGTAAVPIKIEDILKLPSRVTRSNRKAARTEFVYVDLETVARQHREAGVSFKFK